MLSERISMESFAGRSPWLVRAMYLALLLSMQLANSAAAATRLDALPKLSDEFRAMSERVTPAIVQVFVVGVAPVSGAPDQLLSRRRASGSGLIVDPAGFIVTNAHVVLGARRIQVRLPSPAPPGSPRQSAVKPRGPLVEARLIGADRETDLAVLQIDGSNLTTLPFADSDEVRQGELAFAFGSPLGLENSVSIGIVSAPVRQLEPDAPMIYIQTDADIHPGNSGGPLVNARGEVIGINTFIASAGLQEAVGFAAPSNIVRAVVRQIREHGRVRRGSAWLFAQTITPELAMGLGIARDWGVVIGDVFPGGPAEGAGLRAGDVVVKLNGKVMENGRQLDVNLYRQQAGEEAVFEILRDGRPSVVRVVLTERPNDLDRLAALANPERNLIAPLEILGLDLEPWLVESMPLRRPTGVLVVASTADAGPHGGPLLPGDIIHSINRSEAHSVGDLRRMLAGHASGDWVTLSIERDGQMMYVAHEIL